MDNGQFCRNCGHYDPSEYCKHDNIERILRQEKAETCPFWVPLPADTAEILADIKRKFICAMETINGRKKQCE